MCVKKILLVHIFVSRIDPFLPFTNYIPHPQTPQSFRAWWTPSTNYGEDPEPSMGVVAVDGWMGLSQCTLI